MRMRRRACVQVHGQPHVALRAPHRTRLHVRPPEPRAAGPGALRRRPKPIPARLDPDPSPPGATRTRSDRAGPLHSAKVSCSSWTLGSLSPRVAASRRRTSNTASAVARVASASAVRAWASAWAKAVLRSASSSNCSRSRRRRSCSAVSSFSLTSRCREDRHGRGCGSSQFAYRTARRPHDERRWTGERLQQSRKHLLTVRRTDPIGVKRRRIRFGAEPGHELVPDGRHAPNLTRPSPVSRRRWQGTRGPRHEPGPYRTPVMITVV